MKKDIQPKYHSDAKIVCACGHVLTVGSTQPETRVEICSSCHPYFTGKEHLIDTQGRVEKFKTRQTKASATPKTAKKKAAAVEAEVQA